MLLIESVNEIQILMDLIRLKEKLEKVVKDYGEMDFLGKQAKLELYFIEKNCNLKNEIKIGTFIQKIGCDLLSRLDSISDSEQAVVLDLIGGFAIEFQGFKDNGGTISGKNDINALECIYHISERLDELKLSDIRTELSEDLYRYNGGRLHRVANLITEQDVMPECTDEYIQIECQKLLKYWHTIDKEIEEREE